MTSLTTQPRVVVPERGTRLRRHAVLTAGEGRFWWVRWPGPEAPCPFSTLAPALRSGVDSLTTAARSRVVAGEDWHRARRYLLSQPTSIAEALITTHGRRPADYSGALFELGRLLRGLHALPVPGDLPRPQAFDRLRGWLDGPALSGQHGTTRRAIRAYLGPGRWDLLATWLEGLRSDPAQAVVHGWLGLGDAAAVRQHERVELVLGEDIGRAAARMDVGWLAGQILELRHFLATPDTAPQFDALLDAWWDGYGRPPDPGVHQAALLDIALHVHDFSAYFTVADGEPHRWAALLAGLIDDPRW